MQRQFVSTVENKGSRIKEQADQKEDTGKAEETTREESQRDSLQLDRYK